MNIELAWSAGFYDGEGCTGTVIVNKKAGYNNPCFVMAVKQVRIEPLIRFQKAVGRRIYGPYHRKRNDGYKSNPIHQWKANGSFAVEVYKKLKPYLSKPKVDQAETALGMIRKIKKARY